MILLSRDITISIRLFKETKDIISKIRVEKQKKTPATNCLAIQPNKPLSNHSADHIQLSNRQHVSYPIFNEKNFKIILNIV